MPIYMKFLPCYIGSGKYYQDLEEFLTSKNNRLKSIRSAKTADFELSTGLIPCVFSY